MKTIIVDDEKPAQTVLTAFVKKVPFLQLELVTSNAYEAITYINQHEVDLLLLDIEMPDLTGIELLQSLDRVPLVIFTTAYEQYALKGYELDVVDYLMKPIPFERFLKAVNKAQKRLSSNTAQLNTTSPVYLLVKSEYQTVKIDLDDILYIEGLKDYVKIFTTEKMILTRLNLKGIGEKLPSAQFVRVHRSFIVSLPQISSFQKSQLMIGDQLIPIGEAYRAQLIQKLE